jgi:hypothetical protein
MQAWAKVSGALSTLCKVDFSVFADLTKAYWAKSAADGVDFSPIYNLPFAVEFLEEINEDIFLQAFTDIVERHIVTFGTVPKPFELLKFRCRNHLLIGLTIGAIKNPINRWFLHLNFNNSNGFGTVPKVTMQRLQVKLHIDKHAQGQP